MKDNEEDVKQFVVCEYVEEIGEYFLGTLNINTLQEVKWYDLDKDINTKVLNSRTSSDFEYFTYWESGLQNCIKFFTLMEMMQSYIRNYKKIKWFT